MKKTILIGLIIALLLAMLPLSFTTASAEASTCKAWYVVKKGETLNQIADRYHVTVNAIVKANHIPNRNRIYPGQKLCIPGVPTPPPPTCTWVWVNGAWSWTCTGTPYWPPPPGPIPPPPVVPPGCSIAPILGFGQVWYNNPGVRAKLGCPKEAEKGITANDEQFEKGYVVQDVSNKRLFVIFGAGGWQQHPDTWQDGEAINNPWLIPPPGFHQPQYGIGKMWRQVDNMSQRLGWARRPQAAINATWQPYDGGMMLWSSTGGIFVLYNSGAWQQFK
ncbi:MAG: LysM domain-containing protein [Caldilineales bacterium]|nr:LysM domain-containing protein [Caldilineales bacterium]